MRTYQWAWAVLVLVVSTTAAMGEVLTGGLARMLAISVAAASLGGIVALVVTEERPDTWTLTRRTVLWSGLGALVADGLIVSWHWAGLAVGVLLVIASPPVLRTGLERGWTGSTHRTGGPPELLATRDLRRRWDWTTAELQRSTTPVARRMVLVEERAALLDELQRRAPAGFDDWVASAVPASRAARPRQRRR